MHREIRRTVLSLSPSYQKGISAEEYEVIVVDNGSQLPIEVDLPSDNVRLIRVEDASPSPAAAVNLGLKIARGHIIGVMIDGARMASPGLLSGVMLASRLHDRPVIATMGFHLGPDLQQISAKRGYCQQAEDNLLSECHWEENGYRLFDVSVFAGSSSKGLFASMGESNALFLTRQMWDELHGFDEQFSSSGGGLVNLDAYDRACGLHDIQLVILLGEGTFHQIHGGASTSARRSPWNEFAAEYARIRGHQFERPNVVPVYVGSVPYQALRFIRASAAMALGERDSSLISRTRRFGAWLKSILSKKES